MLRLAVLFVRFELLLGILKILTQLSFRKLCQQNNICGVLCFNRHPRYCLFISLVITFKLVGGSQRLLFCLLVLECDKSKQLAVHCDPSRSKIRRK